MHEFTPKPIQLIAVYARVSTARQEEEGTIETQLSAIREFAAKNNYVIAKDYVDNGWSGDMLARPALDQLREDAKKKLWQAVLIYDPDRLARRYSYQELVMDELRELGIETLFVTVAPSRNQEDRLLNGVRGIFAEYERTKITERFRLGRLRKAKEGHIMTAEAPYGYAYIRKKDKTPGYYEINHEEAVMVRRIFAFVADEGLTNQETDKASSRAWRTVPAGQAGYMAHKHVVPASEK
jgi:site-specific DNA recombinase